ncbi:hypothetical protein Ssi03_13130 [Sphaerisporangium siamense]|uniref:Uncharacterized protein n=1 Tax=Sphaerisporangium siamense TaxID=795645 RepID=A0A7W7DCL6_9ACTN|nr:hypothetical protein [Sphaerisporangium siamense]GII83323.1 hypothetical protein Ssi03_13130 [Sphaerisporangium siamense]
MTCEIFLCQEDATHKVRVKVPGLPISLSCLLCEGHATGGLNVEGRIIECEAMA